MKNGKLSAKNGKYQAESAIYGKPFLTLQTL